MEKKTHLQKVDIMHHSDIVFRWVPENVIYLATMFKDVPMSDDELKFVILKIMKMFEDIDLQEFPPLVYQLLLLSAKVPALICRKQV